MPRQGWCVHWPVEWTKSLSVLTERFSRIRKEIGEDTAVGGRLSMAGLGVMAEELVVDALWVLLLAEVLIRGGRAGERRTVLGCRVRPHWGRGRQMWKVEWGA